MENCSQAQAQSSTNAVATSPDLTGLEQPASSPQADALQTSNAEGTRAKICCSYEHPAAFDKACLEDAKRADAPFTYEELQHPSLASMEHMLRALKEKQGGNVSELFRRLQLPQDEESYKFVNNSEDSWRQYAEKHMDARKAVKENIDLIRSVVAKVRNDAKMGAQPYVFVARSVFFRVLSL